MPAQQPEKVQTEFWVTVVPKWDRWSKDKDNRPVLEGVTATKITQSRPETTGKGGIVTRLRLVVDASIFVPLQPEATILIGHNDVEVIYEADATDAQLFVPTPEDQ